MQIDVVAKLLQNGADMNATDKVQKTALHWALYGENHFDVAKLLIRNGADVNAQDVDQYGALHFMLEFAIGEVAQSNADFLQLLIRNGVDLNAVAEPSDGGFTALGHSAHYGDIDFVKVLIQNGADVNALHGYCDESTAL